MGEEHATDVHDALDVHWDHDAGVTPLQSRRELRAERDKKPAKQPTKLTDKFMAQASSLPRLPKASMIGAIGVAAVAAPILVQNAIPASQQDTNMANNLQTDAAPPPIVSNPGESVDGSTNPALIQNGDGVVSPVVSDELGATLDPDALIAARLAAEQASRDFNRNPLPGCDPNKFNAGSQNGQLNQAELCALDFAQGHRLRADAAVALAKLNEEYKKKFGDDLSMTDSYRSLALQKSLKRRKPGLAARPGTSNHGWGLAVDLSDGIEGANHRYLWMRKNAPKYGWDNPEWARVKGSGKYEPWHWEYVAAKDKGSEAGD